MRLPPLPAESPTAHADPGFPARPLAQLGLEPADEAAIRRVLPEPLGLVLVVGPRRSGRSSTLAALIAALPAAPATDPAGTPGLRLLDPAPTPLGLRRAVAAVPLGCRVFASLALERAAHVFAHCRAIGLPPALLARDLQFVLAQSLVRRLCPACRLPDRSAQLRGAMAQAANSWLADTPWEAYAAQPGGCTQCAGQGHKGQVLAYELVVVTPGVRALAEQGAVGLEMEQILFSDGRSLWDQGLRLVARGQCSLQALRAAVREPR
jgi:type II secretory ATPase GspE/PulE/Tfp pilus assembly ATPase PilB-like protein